MPDPAWKIAWRANLRKVFCGYQLKSTFYRICFKGSVAPLTTSQPERGGSQGRAAFFAARSSERSGDP
jgi:hypothetical protein